MKIKRILDVSRKIRPGMVLWPGDNDVELKEELRIGKGNICNLTSIGMSLHTGTHIDAPYHFIDGGDTADKLDLSRFIGMVKVFEIDNESSISCKNLAALGINEGDAVFLKTKSSYLAEEEPFITDYPFIEPEAAEFLVQKGIRTIGVDYLSVDQYSDRFYSAHKILLSKGVGIIEGLRLAHVEEGEYFFSCLPLNIPGVDGSPARAVLLELE